MCANASKVSFHPLMLQVFSCVMNPVKYIHSAAFRGLVVLEHLKLQDTQLHQLPSFQHIGHSLTKLDIIVSAHYTGNYAQDFTNLRNIKYIDMIRNGLRNTPLGLNLIANTIMALDLQLNAINSLTSMEGVKFMKLLKLDLRYNNITHLHPELLITPHLQSLHLVGNHLVSLADVTQYSWGSSLSRHKYMALSATESLAL